MLQRRAGPLTPDEGATLSPPGAGEWHQIGEDAAVNGAL